MKEIYFVTGNMLKFEKVKSWMQEINPNIILKQCSTEIPEIQSLDMEKVAIEKAKAAWNLLKKPVIIDDSGIFLTKYNNFPGTLSKFVYEGIGLDGFWLLAKNNPEAVFKTYLIYYDSEEIKIFRGECKGNIHEPKNYPPKSQMPYIYVFKPENCNKIYAEIHDSEEIKTYDHRYKSVKSLMAWLKERK